jgi:hypothetical protein
VGDALFADPPDRIERQDISVMERSTDDDLPHIQGIWPVFECLVGLRGRKMYDRVDGRRKTYTVCTPVKPDDDPGALGLERGTLPGGAYLRGRLIGEPSWIYPRIGIAVQELESQALIDQARPVIEFYRRHDQVELWIPFLPRGS